MVGAARPNTGLGHCVISKSGGDTRLRQMPQQAWVLRRRGTLRNQAPAKARKRLGTAAGAYSTYVLPVLPGWSPNCTSSERRWFMCFIPYVVAWCLLAVTVLALALYRNL